MGKLSLGLDIGHQQIKVVVVEKKRAGVRLQGWGLVNTPPGTIVKGKVENPARLQQILKGLVQEHGWRGTRTAIGLTDPEIVLKIVEFPIMSAKELAQALEFELGELVSFPFAHASDVAWSYEPMRSESDQQNILFAGCPRQLVMSYVTPTRQAELEVAIVDVKSLSLTRGLQESEDYVYIDIGHMQTNIYVQLNGQYRLSRILPVGGRDFSDGIMAAYSVNFEEAERRKREVSLDDLISEASANPSELRGTLQQFTNGVGQTLDYLRSLERVSTVSQLVQGIRLCGGGAEQKGLANVLRDDLDLPVSIFNPFLSLDAVTDLPAQPTVFAGAVGMALRGLERE